MQVGIGKALVVFGVTTRIERKLKMSYVTKWQRPGLASWGGLGRLSNLTAEMDRLFGVPPFEFACGSQLLSGWTPALDVYEDKESVTVKAELPGLKREEIEVSLHDGTLSISGERKSEEKHEDTEVYRAE